MSAHTSKPDTHAASAKQGQLVPDVAIVDTPSATILASGTISLTQEQLALTLTSHPKSLSLLSLSTPVDVSGSFANPSVRLHSHPFGTKVLAATALSSGAPLATLIPMVDVGQHAQHGCKQAWQARRSKMKTSRVKSMDVLPTTS